MAATIKELIKSKYAENAATTQYTVASGRALLDSFTATNTSGSNATLTVYIVPSGGSSGASNAVISARTIAPGECYTCPEMVGKGLEVGSYIATLAGAASAIVIHSSGREVV